VSPRVRLILLSSAAIIFFDVAASLASRTLGFNYAKGAVGSYFLYAVAGFLAARRTNLLFAAQLGAVVGFVDATIGWAVSSAIGPIVPATPHLTVTSWALIAFFVVLTSLVCALVGGAIGRATQRSSPSAA
jgi:hypothetical protein